MTGQNFSPSKIGTLFSVRPVDPALRLMWACYNSVRKGRPSVKGSASRKARWHGVAAEA